MKKYLLPLSFLLFLTIGIKDSFALTSTRAPIATIVGTTTGENAGSIIFSSDVTTQDIDGTNKWAYIKSIDNKFYGYFWIENVGWATFEGLGANQASLSASTGTDITVNGYAWSENAGWISFVNGVNDTKFNAITGKFSGYAWSENLGWIDMASISGGADITPPTFTSTIFAAEDSKSMVINDTNLGGNYQVQLDRFSSTDNNFYSKTSTFSHDFRTAKDYNYQIKDPTGNSTSGTIHVVANIPATLDTVTNIGTLAEPNTYPSSSSLYKIADGNDLHQINIKLRDEYGNKVIDDTTAGKTVTVTVGFDNQINARQFSPSSPLYYEVNSDLNTLKFNGTNFGLLGTDTNKSLSNSPDGDYSFKVASYAPTINPSLGGSGSLKLTNFSYNITGGTNVGGTIYSSTPNYLYGFSPAFGVSDVAISGGWTTVSVNNEKTFTGTTYNSGSNINTTAVSHILDIKSNEFTTNVNISFKNPISNNSNTICNVYSTGSGYGSTKEDNACKFNIPLGGVYSSDVYLKGTNNYKWTPTLNLGLPLPSSMDINYRSEVVYTYSNGITVGHGSLEKAGGKVANRQIKITGITNDNSKNMITQSGSNNIKIIGTINKLDLKTSIYKNVESLTKNGVPSSSSISYSATNQTINSWPFGKDTIIVKGANIYITGDINKTSGKVKAIVALKDNNGHGGNIFVSKDVKFIAATIFADGGLISGDGTTYYADSDSLAQDQLFIKGSLITSNTIGGSFKNPQTCPYGVIPCNNQNSKRYDLNLFRHYIIGAQGNAVSGTYGSYTINLSAPGYAEAPLIIEADKDIPPKVFQYNSTK